MKNLFIILVFGTSPLWGQVNYGELRLKIIDPSDRGINTAVELTSIEGAYDHLFNTNEEGTVSIQRLPFSAYQIRVRQVGFAPLSKIIELRSALPLYETLQLTLASENTQIRVAESPTLIDPYSPSSVMRIGASEIQQRLSYLPRRSIQDLIDSQPGWLYEGNAVLHPRGSEYQTQFVIDGIPLTDNRSPGSGPEIEVGDLDSISVYTAGYPAEYGRKMGGVVEINTAQSTSPGLHGQLVISGGSYDAASIDGRLQSTWGRNTLGISSSTSKTSHYLNPVVPENYTNKGTMGDFSVRYERNLTDNDRLSLVVRHEFSRYLIPNELPQEQAGQMQSADNFETMGTVNYQHIMSSDSLFAFAGMVRNNANNLYSNQNSTPIIAFQHNNFNEGYFKGKFSFHHRRQEIKAGVESDAIFLHENFSYEISASDQFDSNTPLSMSFLAQRPDLEQSAFVEDLIRLGKWTVSAGIRWDHYQLLVNRNSASPRISISRYLPSLDMVFHASYDRVFQTPAFENILISSSAQIDALSSQFLRLPVQPSTGDYYEGGFTKNILDQLRIDVNGYRREVKNYADDDQLLNTGVSYPIAFDKAVIYGAETKIAIVQRKFLGGFASYSYMVGNAWFPVTGGLFLGQDANNAISQIAGHFSDSQDQRNTLKTRFELRPKARIWFAAGTAYGSGLPFAYGGTQAEALAEYGSEMIDRLNFNRGHVRPTLAINSTVGLDIYKREKETMHLQIDGDNLNNRLNVLDFGGLFSGNAIAPARSITARLSANF